MKNPFVVVGMSAFHMFKKKLTTIYLWLVVLVVVQTAAVVAEIVVVAGNLPDFRNEIAAVVVAVVAAGNAFLQKNFCLIYWTNIPK